MTTEINKREIRFSIHIPKRSGINEDYHYIKECITYSDGTSQPNTYLVKDFKRPVWVTKEHFRKHAEKKEFEDLDKLKSTMCTQSDINRGVACLLGKPNMANYIRDIKNSPFVYGYDITSTSHIKLKSLEKNKFIQSGYSLAVLDIENDVVTKEILMISVVMRDKIHTSILSKFIARSGDYLSRIKNAINAYIPMYKDIPITVEVFDSEVDMIKNTFRVANEWKPDFLAIWNIDYDIPLILERLGKYKVNPIDVLCDQSIPRELRLCKYKQGVKKKIAASGKLTPINPSMQWHTLTLTASFYVIDAMCTYRQLRLSQQDISNYALDNILDINGLQRKLTFKQADLYKGIKWHIFMQENYPIEYVVYNMYDCLGVLELDLKNKDLSNTLPSFAGITDFYKFNSNPKKIVDAMYMYAMKKERIIGTVGMTKWKEEELVGIDEDVDEYIEEDNLLDNGEEDVTKFKTLNLKNWILTLPQHLLMYDGLQCIEEFPNLKTNLRGLVADSDVSSSYPNCGLVCNVSKETTLNEIIRIDGVNELTFRTQNLGFVLGGTAMLDYFNVMFDMPSLEKIDSLIDNYM